MTASVTIGAIAMNVKNATVAGVKNAVSGITIIMIGVRYCS